MNARKSATFATISLSVLALAACHKSPEPGDQASTPAPGEAMVAPAGPDAKPGTSAEAARLVLPVVAGRPAAVYFRFTNSSDKPVVIAAVHVEGAASAEMHKTEGGKMSGVKTLPVKPGETVTFAPGGYHVMAFGLDKSLASGGSSELTLTFSDSDKISMPLAIEKMGAGMSDDMGSMGDMPMDHGAMDHAGMDGMKH